MNMLTQKTHNDSQKQVALWLFIISGLVGLMVLVGGLTRLTDSGLSITEWRPLMGAIPPLNAADWQVAFDKYKQIPEYIQINAGMSLAEFKVIFWWEWAHRFLGRLVGVAFFIPFIIFLLQGKIPRRKVLPLTGLFLLGGAQGVLGWYMVQSGLSARVDVSQYRLAAHLSLALIIMVISLWFAFDFWRGVRARQNNKAVRFAFIMVVLVLLQSVLGAFVAGIDAGLMFNTWPLMEGGLIPADAFSLSPLWVNFFENHAAVQFNHRMFAYILFAFALWGCVWLRSRAAIILFILISLQAGVGIITLLAAVPIWLGFLHQCGALIVLVYAVSYLHRARFLADDI